jgi:hypothetical protein
VGAAPSTTPAPAREWEMTGGEAGASAGEDDGDDVEASAEDSSEEDREGPGEYEQVRSLRPYAYGDPASVTQGVLRC